jgi:hypothetical protein
MPPAVIRSDWPAEHPEHRLEQREEESREAQARRRRGTEKWEKGKWEKGKWQTGEEEEFWNTNQR